MKNPTCIILAPVLALLWPAAGKMALSQKISDLGAYERYYQMVRSDIGNEVGSAEFLNFRKLPQAGRATFEARLKKGEVIVARIDADQELNGALQKALIHHWRGTFLVPDATLSDIVAFAQNYPEHSKFFKNDVVQSKIVDHGGNFYRVFYKLRRTKVITVYYNTEYDGLYHPVNPLRQWSESRATRIAELEAAETPEEKEKPAGKDHGFLWKLDSFWKFEQVGDGVIIECTSVSLSRDIPFGLGVLIRRFVNSIPRESLERTLRTFLLARR